MQARDKKEVTAPAMQNEVGRYSGKNMSVTVQEFIFTLSSDRWQAQLNDRRLVCPKCESSGSCQHMVEGRGQTGTRQTRNASPKNLEIRVE